MSDIQYINKINPGKKSKVKRKFLKYLIILLSAFFLSLAGVIALQSYSKDVPFMNQASDTLSVVFGRGFIDSVKKIGYNVMEDIKEAKDETLLITNKSLKNENKSESENIDKELGYDKLSVSNNQKGEGKLIEAAYVKETIGKLVDIEPLILKPVLKNEGKWQVLDSQKYLQKTIIRPDVKKRWARAFICAIDIETIDMHLVFGSQYKDKNGKYGTGRIDTKHKDVLIASFNGGFQPKHDKGGIVINGVEYLSLQYDKGTLVIYEDGDIEIVNWTKETEEIILNKNKRIKFIRQNQPILLNNGEFNSSVKRWGFVLRGTDPIYAFRSAIGISADGKYFYYIAGPSLSPESIARALTMAGAVNGMHIDMNISNVAFNYYEKNKKNRYIARSLGKNTFWKSMVGRYLRGYTHDFFYLTSKTQ